MPTTTRLYNIYQSELQKRGFNEFIDHKGDLILFDSDVQFIQKILSYDEDIQDITDWLFKGLKLNNTDFDIVFKRNFVYKFMNRRIGRETIESFQLELMSTFMMNSHYLNEVYENLQQYILSYSESEGSNTQDSTGKNISNSTSQSDNRQAFAELPQNTVNLDVDNSIMSAANDNTISRDKNTSNQIGNSENKSTGSNDTKSIQYNLNNLLQSSKIVQNIFNEFDRNCFSQII